MQELRDPQLARQYVLQSLWLARGVNPNSASAGEALTWAVEIASAGDLLPPLGFLADAGNLALSNSEGRIKQLPFPPGVDRSLVRRYEDYVLAKLTADLAFERAVDAVAGYKDRDRDRAVAYLLNRMRERSGTAGVLLSPGLLKNLREEINTGGLTQAWQEMDEDGPLPQLMEDFESLILNVRNTGDLVGAEDIFELEKGTALAQFAQRLALRQTLQATQEFYQRIGPFRVKSSQHHRQIATQLRDEDTYPVGGFSSVSNRGSIESMLHSQLAYLETDDGERPDLFDIKYLRDELLYYSRDENQFLRRRKTYVFAIFPDVVSTRIKDAELPWQRIVLLLGLMNVTVRKLIEWLSDDHLTFEFLFVDASGAKELADEKELLHTLFDTEIENGTVIIKDMPVAELAKYCDEHSRRSVCQVLSVSQAGRAIACDLAFASRLQIRSGAPSLMLEADDWYQSPERDLDAWHDVVDRLLRHWV